MKKGGTEFRDLYWTKDSRLCLVMEIVQKYFHRTATRFSRTTNFKIPNIKQFINNLFNFSLVKHTFFIDPELGQFDILRNYPKI